MRSQGDFTQQRGRQPPAVGRRGAGPGGRLHTRSSAGRWTKFRRPTSRRGQGRTQKLELPENSASVLSLCRTGYHRQDPLSSMQTARITCTSSLPA
jgi:hypothetical protein